MKKVIYCISIMLLMLSCGKNQSKEDKEMIEYAQRTGYKIKSNDVKNADPAIIFSYSAHLWNEGQKDDAVFWYYVAQYRYRFLSSCSEYLQAGSWSEVAANGIISTACFEKQGSAS
jgi:hypothetical protein